MRNDHNLNRLIEKTAQAMDHQQPLLVASLTVKLQKLAETFPHDLTVLAVANIVSKLDGNKRLILTRGELKDLYNKSWTNSTKFAEFFQEEMGLSTSAPTAPIKNDRPMENVQAQFSDPVLANALESIFDKTIPLKQFSNELADKAKEAVGRNLEAWNLKANRLQLAAGNESFLIVQAEYETPKGLTSILVPVEVQSGKIIEPSLFMGNSGPQDLNNISLKSYVAKNAGVKLRVKASDMLSSLSATIKTASISSVELALTKMNATKENPMPFFGDAVLGQSDLGPVRKDVSLPQSGQFQSFAEKFESPLGYASLQFGLDKVNLGRDVVARTIASFGLKAPQVALLDANENTIVYAVSLNGGKICFAVPVKIQNNRIINPELLICNGSVSPFSKQGVSRLFQNNEKDYRAAAATSAQYGLKPNELIQNVREAMIEGNYTKAEDALNILADGKNQEAYKIAFTIFTNGLSLSKQAASEKTTCSLPTKNANFEGELCSHTGLPLNKVYQDQHGHCHPLYRRAQEENQEAVLFMDSKIFG